MTPATSGAARARRPHLGVFITGPGKLELLQDELPPSTFDGEQIVIEALGNCRCSSDKKAIVQFRKHARIPDDAEQVALGHEVIQRVVHAPPGSPVTAGDLVLITPGHVATPHDPATFEPSPGGVLTSLGYSYRYLGGLRQFSAVPVEFIDIVKKQGFGDLFNKVSPGRDVSLASLAHAEPFACCFGTIRNMFFVDDEGEFVYGIPPRTDVAFLGGTARMAMIKLTIIAARPDDELPRRIGITGSQRKLDALQDYALIRDLRRRGVEVRLVDRSASDVVEKLAAGGKYPAVFTNYPSQEVFDQAVQLIAPGGNLNNYAGAVDPDIYFPVQVGAVPAFASLREEAHAQIRAMHHNRGHNDPRRVRGIAGGGTVGLFGFAADGERLKAYLGALPPGVKVYIDSDSGNELPQAPDSIERLANEPEIFTDVFIAGTGKAPAELYERLEPKLARSAAVNLVDGDVTLRVRSKHIHYASRHQICGPTVPFSFTNTSEPISEDLARQGAAPVDFDWMVKGVSGLEAAIEMIEDVTEREPFGSFFAMPQLNDFPYVTVSAAEFRKRADELASSEGETPRVQALRAGAAELERHGDVWSRRVEEAIYAAYGKTHPLNEKPE